MASFKTEGIAIVIGAATGIGQGVGNAFALAGASVVVFADINVETAEKSAADSLKLVANSNTGYKAFGWKVDVTDRKSVEDLFARAKTELGRIDYVVNSAGVDNENYTTIPDDDQADFDRVLSINMRGILLCTREAVRIMQEQSPRPFKPATPGGRERDLGRGSIVNVLSVLAYMVQSGKVGYITSKHAAMGITKATAQDVMSKNIRINALCPSFVRTPMHTAQEIKVPGVNDFIKAVCAAGRPLEPEEVGEAAVYLCSPAGCYIHGSGLIMDSGATLTAHVGM